MFPNSRIERQRPGSISNVRTRPNPIWPGPGVSGFPIRAVPGGRLCQATVNLTKGVPPISRNFLAINLWGRICLDLAVILAEFQRAFSKREYGGSNPPAPANQSGLCVWSDRPTIIGPLPGFLHQPAVSGIPKRVKQASRELLMSIKARLAELDRFWEKEQTKADVEVFILDKVFASLPTPPFTPEEKKRVAEQVYTHVWQQAMTGELARAP
jgi:hypothetical protein